MRSTIRRVHLPKPDACWLQAPPESSPEFLPVFRVISVAVQRTLRERLPKVYFADSKNFEDPRKAYPMLVYQASRPFHARTKTELTYDVLNPKMTRRLFRSVRKNLIEILGQVETRLRAEGLPELADQYVAKRVAAIVKSVKKLATNRRALYSLIRSESLLVEALVHLGGLGSVPIEERTGRVASFGKRWDFQTRRLYKRKDFAWLGAVLLDEATRALRACLDEHSGVDVAGGVRVEPEPGAA